MRSLASTVAPQRAPKISIFGNLGFQVSLRAETHAEDFARRPSPLQTPKKKHPTILQRTIVTKIITGRAKLFSN